MGLSTAPTTTSINPTAGAFQGLPIGSAINPLPGQAAGLSTAATAGLQNFLATGGMGGPGVSAGQSVINAAQPIFMQNMQRALGQLQSSAPGRYGTAFTGQGIGLQQRALQDFNLFQQQALQQGMQTDLQALLGAGAQSNNLLSLLMGTQQPIETIVGPSKFQQLTGGIEAIGNLIMAGKKGGL